MGIPRVRFTIRLLMITVAIVGVFLTAARLAFFWRHYQALAAMHASKEVNYVRQAQQYERKHDWRARQATIANLESESIRGGTWERLATSFRVGPRSVSTSPDRGVGCEMRFSGRTLLRWRSALRSDGCDR